jgi:hypothetical protein
LRLRQSAIARACAAPPFRPGQVHETKTSRRPSGIQRKASTPVATLAARRASPPSGAIT